MKAKLLTITAVLFFSFLITACKKDPTGPKIGLKFKSVNGSQFALGDRVVFKFEFTPKTNEADSLFVVRKFFTCAFYPTPDTLSFQFPDFPNDGKADLEYAFVYGSGGFFYDGCYNGVSVRRTDSLTYKFWVKDKDGNVSDTIVSPKIVLLK